MAKSDPLFSPLKIGNEELKNRIALAPLTRGRAGKERVPNEIMSDYYFQRSGAGVMISEATVISSHGIGWIDSPGMYTDEMESGWKKICDRIRPTGSLLFYQMWHVGRASHSDFHGGELPVSASAIKLNAGKIRTPQGKKDFETPRALEISEIKETVKDFARSAERAKRAGFYGIEIHSANGYLLNQFLDSKSNQRNDEYGGSLENRFRFLREVVEAVVEIMGPSRVAVRLSPNGIFNDMGGSDYREIFDYAISELNKYDLAYLHVMDGLAFGFHEQGEPYSLADVRKNYSGIIMGNCGYDAKKARAVIEEGNGDLISFGRPFISNPDLPDRIRNNWPLASWEDMTYWYTSEAKGYTDYPVFQK